MDDLCEHGRNDQDVAWNALTRVPQEGSLLRQDELATFPLTGCVVVAL